ncbi:50S ribosomal protein L15 [Patescibacteria group bacterium]|nr:50S ribosomal protein L15 [Patescibacteria group bacterium]MCH7756730.1 50S ribosomal protein L15 [Patescibacteria group bacterium]
MQLNEIKRRHPHKTKMRIGRGGKRGKTSGRGHKGQKAHGGHGIRPEHRDVIKKLPKRRGYRFKSFQQKAVPVNIGLLEEIFESGATVTPKKLVQRKIIAKAKGRGNKVKILGYGTLSKKLSISGCSVSKNALEQIEKVGGSVTI